MQFLNVHENAFSKREILFSVQASFFFTSSSFMFFFQPQILSFPSRSENQACPQTQQSSLIGCCVVWLNTAEDKHLEQSEKHKRMCRICLNEADWNNQLSCALKRISRQQLMILRVDPPPQLLNLCCSQKLLSIFFLNISADSTRSLFF